MHLKQNSTTKKHNTTKHLNKLQYKDYNIKTLPKLINTYLTFLSDV